MSNCITTKSVGLSSSPSYLLRLLRYYDVPPGLFESYDTFSVALRAQKPGHSNRERILLPVL